MSNDTRRPYDEALPIEWRDIPGYEGIYQVSSVGDVRRMAGSPKCRTTRILRPSPRTNGYLYVSLCKNSRVMEIDTHRLVAWAFIGSQNNLWVNHINGVKSDNRLENLEYRTPSGNAQHAYDVGLQPSRKGSGNGYSKLSEQDAWDIRAAASMHLKEIGGRNGIAKVFGVSKTTVTEIINGNLWSHVEVSL